MTLADGLSALADGEFIKQLIPSVAFLAQVADAARNLAPELTRTGQESKGTTQTNTRSRLVTVLSEDNRMESKYSPNFWARIY